MSAVAPGDSSPQVRPGLGPVGEIVGVLSQLPPGAWTEQKADMAAECIALARRIVQAFPPEKGTPNDAVRLFQLGVLMLEAARAEAMVRQAEGGPQEYPLVEACFAGGDEGRDLMMGLMQLAARHGTQRRAS